MTTRIYSLPLLWSFSGPKHGTNAACVIWLDAVSTADVRSCNSVQEMVHIEPQQNNVAWNWCKNCWIFDVWHEPEVDAAHTSEASTVRAVTASVVKGLHRFCHISIFLYLFIEDQNKKWMGVISRIRIDTDEIQKTPSPIRYLAHDSHAFDILWGKDLDLWRPFEKLLRLRHPCGTEVRTGIIHTSVLSEAHVLQ